MLPLAERSRSIIIYKINDKGFYPLHLLKSDCNVSFMSERIWLVAPDSADTFISSHKSQETVSPKPQWDILSS